MGLTVWQKIVSYLAFCFCAVFGWWEWHRRDADFFNMFVGSYVCVGSLICLLLFTIGLLVG